METVFISADQVAHVATLMNPRVTRQVTWGDNSKLAYYAVGSSVGPEFTRVKELYPQKYFI